jgi:hypothetical protein
MTLGRALRVAGGLHVHAGQGGALLLGLDDAGGIAVHCRASSFHFSSSLFNQ